MFKFTSSVFVPDAHAVTSCFFTVTAVTSAKEAIRVLESTDIDTFQLILTVWMSRLSMLP